MGKRWDPYRIRGFREESNRPPLVAVTCYDYAFATILDPLVDILLVGDSLGMVLQGDTHTLRVSVDHMVYHTELVARGSREAHLVSDLPFMSYETSPEQALESAARLIRSGAEAVKLEGGGCYAETVHRLVQAGIPVLGHLGLTPQRFHTLGGFRVQGRTQETRENLLNDAKALADAGAYAIVLEGIPSELGARITQSLTIPTIGIGAGPETTGQILVLHDLLGLQTTLRPRFVKQYAALAETVRSAIEAYAADVRDRVFPGEEHSFS